MVYFYIKNMKTSMQGEIDFCRVSRMSVITVSLSSIAFRVQQKTSGSRFSNSSNFLATERLVSPAIQIQEAPELVTMMLGQLN